jgi:hypothetical protein
LLTSAIIFLPAIIQAISKAFYVLVIAASLFPTISKAVPSAGIATRIGMRVEV